MVMLWNRKVDGDKGKYPLVMDAAKQSEFDVLLPIITLLVKKQPDIFYFTSKEVMTKHWTSKRKSLMSNLRASEEKLN